MQRTTEHGAAEAALAEALTAAINAGRFELANRIIAELERRAPAQAEAPVIDLAEQRAARGGNKP